MAKGEQNGNRESKKPKKNKVKTIAAAQTKKVGLKRFDLTRLVSDNLFTCRRRRLHDRTLVAGGCDLSDLPALVSRHRRRRHRGSQGDSSAARIFCQPWGPS